MNLSYLTAISPIDGRYSSQVIFLRNIFSEYALIKLRIEIEIKWLKKLSEIQNIIEVPTFSLKENIFLENIIKNFNENDALIIKKIESKTKHDVKAVEYFLKQKISSHKTLKNITEFIHFACTSEDINNLSYAMILKKSRDEVIIPYWKKLISTIKNLSIKYKNISFISKTHGQPATPSTIGKEFANIVYRLQRQLSQLKKIEILGKFNGAVGNYNAHTVSYPNINWPKISESFVCSLDICWNPYTTQIEPHDYIAELFNCISRFNTILIDFNRDIWGYISLNYFKQKKNSTKEIGSSTMPHKINPIDFENSEGNLGLSNALLQHMSNKLPISRWQRDLTDSTVLRNIGVCISYSIIAYQSIIKGFSKLEINFYNIINDLNNNWQVLAEPIQTVMRRYGIKNSYEKLKKLTRGNVFNKKIMISFINSLEISELDKKKLKSITPKTYIGLSIKLVDEFFNKKI